MQFRVKYLLFWFLFIFFVLLPDTIFSIEKIVEYKSTIEVEIDGTIGVTEEITIIAEGRQIKRGIFRTFPTTYKDKAGNRIKVDFQVNEILRDGLPEPYHIKKRANGVAIYMGQKNVFLQPGNYTYIYKYILTGT